MAAVRRRNILFIVLSRPQTRVSGNDEGSLSIQSWI
jgi:hypothetical protein